MYFPRAMYAYKLRCLMFKNCHFFAPFCKMYHENGHCVILSRQKWAFYNQEKESTNNLL
jgi:hypothetical protein